MSVSASLKDAIVSSTTTDSVDWREFEKLISRIEHALSPIGAVVASPDYLRDTVTGGLRQVDASIRAGRDGPPLRVLECRDREKTQDVMWIEQLVTKSRDIGIPITAVASSGFSDPALAKAAHYGIEIRTIAEVTDDVIKEWWPIRNFQNMVFRSKLAASISNTTGKWKASLSGIPGCANA